MDNFTPMVSQFQGLFSDKFAGALLRPHGPLFAAMLEMGVPVHDVLEAAQQAGRELVRDGRMSQDILDKVGRELMPLEDCLRVINQNFRNDLEKLEVMAMAD